MCCRYFTQPSGDLAPMIEAAKRAAYAEKLIKELGVQIVTEGEVYPTNTVPVIAPGKDRKESVFLMKWGFSSERSKAPTVNARVESAADKPTFRESFAKRRCVIPASYYFEWEHYTDPRTGKSRTGDKYMIRPAGKTRTMLAGIYRIEEIKGVRAPVFAILTQEPGEGIRFIHDRMPVIIPEDAVSDWIDPDGDPFKVLERVIKDVEYRKA